MRSTVIAVTLCLFSVVANGAREAPVTVVRGDILTSLELSGNVSSGHHVELFITPLQWRGKWLIQDALEAGSKVSEGDVIMRFLAHELSKAVEDSRRKMEWASRDHGIAVSRRDLKVEAAKESLERLEHALFSARRSLGAYRDVALPNAGRRADLDEASSRFGLDNAKEELAQLLKMYEEDELLDDTEKIVLERARWDVANREARLKLMLKRRSYTIEFEEKVRLESLGREVERLERDLARAREEEKLSDAARRIEVERAEFATEERVRRHEELAQDLAAMTVRSPAAGILLHGPVEGSAERRFTRGNQPGLSSAIASIAAPAALVAVFQAPAAQALRLTPGLAVRVVPAAKGALPVEGRVIRVSALPLKGSFRVEVEVEGGMEPALLGTDVKGHASVLAARGALLVPLAAIERKGEKAFVTLGEGKGSPPRRIEVTVGADDGKMIEVREGLEEGMVIVMPEKGR